MKAKVWLVQKGHLESAGRGRMPLRVLPILQEAVKSGVTFSDWPKGKVTTDSKGTVAVERNASDGTDKNVPELAPFRYPEELYQAVQYTDGKRIIRSLREACQNCRWSLVQCSCGEPTIVALDARGSVRVTIEQKPENSR